MTKLQSNSFILNPLKTKFHWKWWLVIIVLRWSVCLPARELGCELCEEVCWPAAPGLWERRGIVWKGWRGWGSVIGGRATLPQLASVESAAAQRASWETQAVRGSRATNAVGGGPGVPLTRLRCARTEERRIRVAMWWNRKIGKQHWCNKVVFGHLKGQSTLKN